MNAFKTALRPLNGADPAQALRGITFTTGGEVIDLGDSASWELRVVPEWRTPLPSGAPHASPRQDWVRVRVRFADPGASSRVPLGVLGVVSYQQDDVADRGLPMTWPAIASDPDGGLEVITFTPQ